MSCFETRLSLFLECQNIGKSKWVQAWGFDVLVSYRIAGFSSWRRNILQPIRKSDRNLEFGFIAVSKMMVFSSSTHPGLCAWSFAMSCGGKLHFRIVFDSVSLSEATMLDTTFFKGPGWRKTGRLDYRLHVKDTRQWRPLLPCSAHPKMVHETWPIAQAKRICNRFSSFNLGKKAAHEFLQSLHAVSIDTETHHPDVSKKCLASFSHIVWNGGRRAYQLF